MTKPLFTDTLRTIRRHFSRFLSILLMVALGTAFFVGMKATAPDMLATAEKYFDDYNLMDLRVRSSIGLTDDDLREIAAIDGVKSVSGEKFTDAFVSVNGAPEIDIDGTRITTRVYAVSPLNIQAFAAGRADEGFINRFQLTSGRYPRSKGECLVDDSRLSTPDTYKLGATITLTDAGEQPPEALGVSSFVIVGVVRAPYYLSFERGQTDIGSGKLGTFILVPDEAFTADYYSEAYVKVDGTEALEPFTQEYTARTAEIKKQIEYKSPALIATRVAQTRPGLAATIANLQNTIDQKQKEANAGLAQLSAGIDTLTNLVNNGEKILADAQKEFNDRFSQIEVDISSGQTAYMQAVQALSQMRAELAANQTAYEQSQQELTVNKEAYDAALSKYNASVTQTQTLRSQLDSTRQTVESAEAMVDRFGDMQVGSFSNEQIQGFITIMQTTYPDLYNSISSLTSGGLAREILAYVRPYLAEQKAKLDEQEADLQEAEALLAAQKTILDGKRGELEAAVLESNAAKAALDQTGAQLDQYAEALQRQGIDIQSSQLEAAIAKVEAQAQLSALETQIKEAPAELQTLLDQKTAIESQLESGLSLARLQLSKAQTLYNRLDNVTWELFDREDSPGYAGYRQTVKNIEVISNIFPIFFFLISSLVCLTTVARLVEEEATVIGTYKALGYGNGPILFKYVFYTLSACVLGSALGMGFAYRFFPMAINAAYAIMYDLPPLTYIFPVKYALLGFLIAVASTVLVTLIAVLGDLRKAPSVLMRPKAPKKGKRILLERIRFLWKRLSFSRKVTARNLFRNKNRFFMTLVGIAGCTAMLLGSVGFYNSISAIKTLQYDAPNAVSAYDLQVVFDLPQPAGAHSVAFNAVAADARIENAELISMKSVVAGSETQPDLLETYVLAPEHAENLSLFFRLRNRETKEDIPLTDDGAVITEKLAKTAGVGVGDKIFYKDAAGAVFGVPVAAIAENYTFHYIFLSPALYKAVTGAEPEYEYAIGTIAPGLKAGGTDLDALKGLLATDLMNVEGVTTVAFTSQTTKSIGEITRALTWVIGIFFVSALVLAVVVLYNLANINIIERTRELATLKVLGFSEAEVGRYILRENITVSFFGILFGVALGVGLHKLLITFTAIDTVMYGQSIYWWAYVLAVVLTAAIIAAVNLLMKRKTAKIDMVLSLKSVE